MPLALSARGLRSVPYHIFSTVATYKSHPLTPAFAPLWPSGVSSAPRCCWPLHPRSIPSHRAPEAIEGGPRPWRDAERTDQLSQGARAPGPALRRRPERQRTRPPTPPCATPSAPAALRAAVPDANLQPQLTYVCCSTPQIAPSQSLRYRLSSAPPSTTTPVLPRPAWTRRRCPPRQPRLRRHLISIYASRTKADQRRRAPHTSEQAWCAARCVWAFVRWRAPAPRPARTVLTQRRSAAAPVPCARWTLSAHAASPLPPPTGATAYVPVQPAIIVGRHMADTFPPGRPHPVDGGTSRPSYMHGSTSSKQSSSTAAADARSARARACARRFASPHRTRTAPQPLAKAGLHFAEPCIYPTVSFELPCWVPPARARLG
ncbi:MAG: hypothetical protein J3K34DRAFT_124165 [Monoraphidium minutum]|nr:MAG: hypothetical protein J3K34DRAFT_124165 [Monoraphidium minutum]